MLNRVPFWIQLFNEPRILHTIEKNLWYFGSKYYLENPIYSFVKRKTKLNFDDLSKDFKVYKKNIVQKILTIQNMFYFVNNLMDRFKLHFSLNQFALGETKPSLCEFRPVKHFRFTACFIALIETCPQGRRSDTSKTVLLPGQFSFVYSLRFLKQGIGNKNTFISR